MCDRGDKQFSVEKIIIAWKLSWIIKKQKKNIIKTLVLFDRADAYELMRVYLNRQKCAWVEVIEIKRNYRIY
jgi:hypothetical protein